MGRPSVSLRSLGTATTNYAFWLLHRNDIHLAIIKSKERVMGMRYFEISDGISNKFWEIRTDALPCIYTVRSGDIETKGRQASKDFYPDSKKMLEQAQKLIAEKIGKGYVEKDMFSRAMASLAAASESIALFEEARRLNRKVPWDLTVVPTQFPNLEHGGIAWRFLVDEMPLKAVDRSKSMLKGPFFITKEYPIPKTEDGKYMIPIIQADLRDLSKLRGVPLGDGLLQVWWTWNENQCRVIPRKVVSELVPLPFPMDVNAFPENEKCYIEDWMYPGSLCDNAHDENERMVPVICGYGDPFICIDAELENANWDEIVSEHVDETAMSEPEDYTRLVKILTKITSGHPSCDHVFGTFHSSHDSPAENALFYFGDEYFGGFGDVGCAQVLYGFKDGKPFFYMTF